jgi:hypothetical protein
MSMATAVKARPNHYEVLGLERGATPDEIARAFAGRMRLGAKSVGATAQLCTAYETLRDPERRRAYDESLDPKPETSPWGIAASQWSGGPYMMSAAASPAPPPASRPRSEPPAPFIAAPLREPVGAEPAPSRAQELLRRLEEQRRPAAPTYREPEQARAPEPKPDAELEQVIAEIRTVGRAERDSLHTADNRGFAWRRPAVAFGGLVVGVGVLGAVAGLSVAGHEQAVQANAVSVPLPRAKPAAVADVPAPASEPAPVADAQPEWRARPAVAARPRTPVARPVVEEAPAETAAQPSFEEAAAAEAPTAAAQMPLPAAVVSRTIERIGYPCGGVASAIPVEGSAGAFTVTCTSGHSYRAAPVRGRYHFRRLGSR